MIHPISPAQASDEPMRDAEIIASFEAAIDNEVSLKPGDTSYWVRQDELLAWFRSASPRATADVERVLTDAEIHAVLDALPISYWDVPQDATVLFARAIIAATKGAKK